MKTKTIRQTVAFPTTPEKLYSLFFDSKKLTEMHGSKTTMTRRPNGKFTAFGGYCIGYNIALAENKRIEQAWLFNEEGWPADHYSTCIFVFEPSAKGTKLKFTQKGVPESKYESIATGWKTYYWYPILQYLLN